MERYPHSKRALEIFISITMIGSFMAMLFLVPYPINLAIAFSIILIIVILAIFGELKK